MKKIFVAVAVFAVGILVWMFTGRPPPSPLESSPSPTRSQSKNGSSDLQARTGGENGNSNFALAAGSSQPAATETGSLSPARVATGKPSEVSTELAPTLPPATVLDNCRVVIHHYHGAFGENPVGNNAEIAAALMGKNPRQTTFIREDAGLRLNENGELLDGWGTPFFFHQVSADIMEIRSAGEDRKLWTFDDLVTR